MKKFVIGYLATGIAITECAIAFSKQIEDGYFKGIKLSDEAIKANDKLNDLLKEYGILTRLCGYVTAPAGTVRQLLIDIYNEYHKTHEKSEQKG